MKRPCPNTAWANQGGCCNDVIKHKLTESLLLDGDGDKSIESFYKKDKRQFLEISCS